MLLAPSARMPQSMSFTSGQFPWYAVPSKSDSHQQIISSATYSSTFRKSTCWCFLVLSELNYFHMLFSSAHMVHVSNNIPGHNVMLLTASNGKKKKTTERLIWESRDVGFFFNLNWWLSSQSYKYDLQHFICTSEWMGLKQRSLANVPKRPRPV